MNEIERKRIYKSFQKKSMYNPLEISCSQESNGTLIVCGVVYFI
jgi:hypothetical protein